MDDRDAGFEKRGVVVPAPARPATPVDLRRQLEDKASQAKSASGQESRR